MQPSTEKEYWAQAQAQSPGEAAAARKASLYANESVAAVMQRFEAKIDELLRVIPGDAVETEANGQIAEDERSDAGGQEVCSTPTWRRSSCETFNRRKR